jgi:hypothetical protein
MTRKEIKEAFNRRFGDVGKIYQSDAINLATELLAEQKPQGQRVFIASINTDSNGIHKRYNISSGGPLAESNATLIIDKE